MTETRPRLQSPLYKRNSREEEAELSLKRTVLSRAVGRFLCLVLLLTICSEFAEQHVADIRAARRQQPAMQAAGRQLFQVYDVFTLLPSLRRAPPRARGFWRYWGTLAPTSEIGAFEDSLGEGSVTSAFVLPYAQYVLTALLGAGNEQAYCGRDRWVYYRPDVDYLIGPGFLEPASARDPSPSHRAAREPVNSEPVGAVLDLHRQLASRGISLVVMPVPAKPMIHPEQLWRRHSATQEALQNRSYQEYRSALVRAEVKVLDVSDALVRAKRTTGRAQYLRLDTHWTPQAMELCAKELARYLTRNVSLPKASAVAYAHTPLAVTNHGDTIDLLKLPKWQRLYAPQTVEIHQTRTAAGALWRPDPAADVLLLGDSFANVYSLAGMGWGERAGLAEQLSFALQRPVDVIARNAGGARSSREALRDELLRGHDRLAGKRVVVYEFAMRDLLSEDWQRLDLSAGTHVREPGPPGDFARESPRGQGSHTDLGERRYAVTRGHDGAVAPGPAPSRQPAARPGAGLRPAPIPTVVTGTIREIARPPRPGSVPYRDCLVGIHLTEIQAQRGAVDGEEILVYVWGLKDNRLSSAAGYRKGQRVTLALIPWDEVEARYGGYNRSEVADEAALLLDAYWSE